MKKIAIAAVLIFLTMCIYPEKMNFGELFSKANNSYEKKMFKDALGQYLFLLKNGYDNFNINYDLGCCYYNLNELGKSRFFFERSLFYRPFDRDLEKNLEIVYNKLHISSGGEQIIMSKRIVFFIPMPILVLLLFLFIVTTVILGLQTYFSKQHKKAYFIIFIIFVFFIVIFNIIFFTQYIDYNNKTFVSTTKLSNVFATPDDYETIIMTLQEGTSGDITEEIDNFVKINLSNGSSGWIKKDDIIYSGNFKKLSYN